MMMTTTRRWMRRTRKMMEKVRRKTRRTMMRPREAQNGQLMRTMRTTRTTSKPRSRKPTTTIDAFPPPRRPAKPLPASSPLTVFICHRWRGRRTGLKGRKIIIIKKNMVISK